MNETDSSPPTVPLPPALAHLAGKEWLTRREAATVLGVNWRTVDRYAKPKLDAEGYEVAPPQLNAYRNAVTGAVRFRTGEVLALRKLRTELRPQHPTRE